MLLTKSTALKEKAKVSNTSDNKYVSSAQRTRGPSRDQLIGSTVGGKAVEWEVGGVGEGVSSTATMDNTNVTSEESSVFNCAA